MHSIYDVAILHQSDIVSERYRRCIHLDLERLEKEHRLGLVKREADERAILEKNFNKGFSSLLLSRAVLQVAKFQACLAAIEGSEEPQTRTQQVLDENEAWAELCRKWNAVQSRGRTFCRATSNLRAILVEEAENRMRISRNELQSRKCVEREGATERRVMQQFELDEQRRGQCMRDEEASYMNQVEISVRPIALNEWWSKLLNRLETKETKNRVACLQEELFNAESIARFQQSLWVIAEEETMRGAMLQNAHEAYEFIIVEKSDHFHYSKALQRQREIASKPPSKLVPHPPFGVETCGGSYLATRWSHSVEKLRWANEEESTFRGPDSKDLNFVLNEEVHSRSTISYLEARTFESIHWLEKTECCALILKLHSQKLTETFVEEMNLRSEIEFSEACCRNVLV